MLRLDSRRRRAGTVAPAAVLCLLGCVTAEAQVLMRIGVTALATDRGSPARIYAGTRRGLYVSQDNGATWSVAAINRLGAAQPSIVQVESPAGSAHVWALSTGSEGVWFSQDRGRTWTLRNAGLPAGAAPQRIYVSADSRTVHLWAGGAVYRTTPAGQAWERRFPLPPETQSLDVNPATPAVMYYTDWERVFRSADGGASFTQTGRPAIDYNRIAGGVRLNGIGDIRSDPANAANALACTAGPTGTGPTANGAFRTVDSGANWTRLNSTACSRIYSRAGDPRAFLGPAVTLATIQISDNGGQTFSPSRTIATGPSPRTSGAISHASDPSLVLAAVNQNDLQTGVSGVYRTTNQGVTWPRLDGPVRSALLVAPSISPLRSRAGQPVKQTVAGRVSVEADPAFALPIRVVAPGHPWLSAELSGSETPADLRITVDSTGLALGTYEGSVTVQPLQEGASEPVTIPVLLEVVERLESVEPLVATVAGSGRLGYSGDGGPAILADLNLPRDVKMNRDGTLLISDRFNHRVRRVDRDGTITTFAGNGSDGNSGDGGAATAAPLSFPAGLAVAEDGTAYIAQVFNLRTVSPDGRSATLRAPGKTPPDNLRSSPA